MNRSRLAELEARRAALVVRSARQRDDIALALRAISARSVLLQPLRAGFRYLRAHPEIVAMALGVLVALRRRRTLKWVSAALGVWEVYRSLRHHLPRS